MVTLVTGFPSLWLFDEGSSMQYKGPKDVKSMTFFINEKVGRMSHKKKVIKREKGISFFT